MSCSEFLELNTACMVVHMVVHCKNLRVVLNFMVISAAHSINILSVIGMFLLLSCFVSYVIVKSPSKLYIVVQLFSIVL